MQRVKLLPASIILKMSTRSNSIDSVSRAAMFPAIRTPMLPKETFKGRVAFITGGGTGLGKSVATMLAQLNADVCIVSR